MRFLREALSEAPSPEPTMSLEGYQGWFYQNQLNIAESKAEQEIVGHQIAELSNDVATLESLEVDLRQELTDNGVLSVESYARFETVLKTIVGEDIDVGVSLESRESDPAAAAEMTLESLSGMITKAKDYLGEKYRTLMERARWLESSFFGGAKKNYAYASKLASEAKRMDESKAGEKLGVSGYVKNYLHLNGSVTSADLTKGLQQENEMFSAMMSAITDIEKEVNPAAQKLVNKLMDDIKADLAWDKVEENVDAGLNDIIEKTTKKYKGKMSKFANTPMLGGRQYVYKTTKVNRALSVDQLVDEKLKNTKGDGYVIPKSKELTDILSELQTMTKSVGDFQNLVKSKDKDIDSMSMEAKESSHKDSQRLGNWLLTYLGSYLVMVIFASIFPPIAIVAAFVNIGSYFGSLSLIIRMVYRKLSGKYDKASKEDMDVSLEANDDWAGVDKATADVKSKYVDLFTGMAAHKNAILRAGLEYSHAAVKAAGVEAPEPEVATM